MLLKSQFHTTFTRRFCKNVNAFGIQMLPDDLKKKLFGDNVLTISDAKQKQLMKNFKGLNIEKSNTPSNDFDKIPLPPLHGKNIEEHFYNISQEIVKPYVQMLENFLGNIPPRPKTWVMQRGWVKYDHQSGKYYGVEGPSDDVLLFDVETMVPLNNIPIMATAVSNTAWYSWISNLLFDADHDTRLGLNNMIPFPPCHPCHKRLFIGHNVSFDRSYIKHQYDIKATDTYFLDTMALHIAISGFTSLQKGMFISRRNKNNNNDKNNNDKKNNNTKDSNKPEKKKRLMASMRWMSEGTMNNLNDVYTFYCNKNTLNKKLRDVFVYGDVATVRDNFQVMMKYCSDDVIATSRILSSIWPIFKKRFPHPATLVGMFEMGSAYLPVNHNWHKYISKANEAYDLIDKGGVSMLQKFADKALDTFADGSYKEDLWLWSLDWSGKKVKTGRGELTVLPKWYHEVCTFKDREWAPTELTLQKRIAPKLLRMAWNGYPLHHCKEHGWGYLVPRDGCNEGVKQSGGGEGLEQSGGGEGLEQGGEDQTSSQPFPYRRLLQHCRSWKREERQADELNRLHLCDDVQEADASDETSTDGVEGPYNDVVGNCSFFKLHNATNPGGNVGNPLGKAFHEAMQQGVMTSLRGDDVSKVLKKCSMVSYWKNSKQRIESQIVVSQEDSGAVILPRIITCGTVTRRAVEPTWLTASNSYADRVGSELKAMIQTPPTHSLVGADVDSQELWLASLLGDAHCSRIHGSTPLGWMTLQGSKASLTDMHSRTAQILGISREHAKVINYARIYGAGMKFTQELLLRFNPLLSKGEASRKTKEIFAKTKGKKLWITNDDFTSTSYWEGGSESSMFNKLEQVACSSTPTTPVLQACISRSLEPRVVFDKFQTSRVNWVVQSSAVDYLHLMLVSMRWLLRHYNISGRFCISIHDEVHYLVAREDRYRAALALQLTNLLTRSMFAYKLGFHNLPQSVAFFSSVEVDSCLRKDAYDECVTPSNPAGMEKEYGIPLGESLSMSDILKITDSKLEK